MRKATVLLVFVFAFIIVNTATSQIRFGPKVGLTISKMYIKTTNTPIYEVIPGYTLGGVADIPLPIMEDHLSFQPSAVLTTKGYKYQIGDFKTVSRPMYFEVPLNVMYNIEIENLKVYAGGGPYIGYGFGGNTKVTTVIKEVKNTTKTKISWGSTDVDHYKPFDFGANINVAFEYENFLAGFNYTIGLLNIAGKSFVPGNGGGGPGVDTKLKNRSYNFTIGYLFGE